MRYNLLKDSRDSVHPQPAQIVFPLWPTHEILTWIHLRGQAGKDIHWVSRYVGRAQEISASI